MSTIILCDGCKKIDAPCLYKIHFALYINNRPIDKRNPDIEFPQQMNPQDSDLCQKCFDRLKFHTISAERMINTIERADKWDKQEHVKYLEKIKN